MRIKTMLTRIPVKMQPLDMVVAFIHHDDMDFPEEGCVILYASYALIAISYLSIVMCHLFTVVPPLTPFYDMNCVLFSATPHTPQSYCISIVCLKDCCH